MKVAVDRRHQPGRLAARRRALRRRAAPRRARDRPGRLPPDRDRRARARAAARRAVAGEGRDDDQLRAARLARARGARPARRGAARLGDLRARRPRARPPRGVRVAQRRRGPRRVRRRRPRAGCATRPASRTRACGARARCSGRARLAPTHPRHRAALHAAGASRTPTAARGSAPTPHAEPGRRARRRLPARAHHRPRRQPVAHDDAHRQVAGAARRRAASRSSRCTRPTPARWRRDGERVRVRSRRGSAILRAAGDRRACRRASRSRRSTGARCTSRPGAGALNNVTARALDPTSKQPELKACAVRVEPVGVRATPARGGRQLVIVGARHGGQWRSPRRVLAHDAGRWQVTIVGGEDDAPYNRVLLSQALAGDVERRARCALRLVRRRGVTLRLGAAARAARRARRARSSSPTATRLPYDELVLATGSRAVAAADPGPGPRGVYAFRSLRRHARDPRGRGERAHARSSSAAACSGSRPRAGCASAASTVTVVHLADRLMELQLDPLAARAARAPDPRARHRRSCCGRRTEAVDRATAWRSPTATELAGRPRRLRHRHPARGRPRPRRGPRGRARRRSSTTSCARRAPGVWAVGECAEHRGTRLRAVGAGARAGARGRRGDRRAPERLPRRGAGDDAEGRGHRPLLRGRRRRARPGRRGGDRARLAPRALPQARPARRRARRRDAARRRRRRAPPARADRERRARPGRAAGDAARRPAAEPDHLVCSCQTVSRGEIVAAIGTHRLTTVEEVSERTGAATGCGGCRPEVEALLLQA